MSRPQAAATAAAATDDDLLYGVAAALAAAIDARDPSTAGHSERVAQMSVRLGQVLELERDAMRALTLGSLLHDVGKIGIPDAILRKPGPLSAAERAIMQRHTTTGRLILLPIRVLDPRVLEIVTHHHERWDGSGYPSGLRGPAIPLLARIVALADAFDAMVSHRPYRPALSPDRAVAEIRRQAGWQFDPELAELFVERVLRRADSEPASTR